MYSLQTQRWVFLAVKLERHQRSTPYLALAPGDHLSYIWQLCLHWMKQAIINIYIYIYILTTQLYQFALGVFAVRCGVVRFKFSQNHNYTASHFCVTYSVRYIRCGLNDLKLVYFSNFGLFLPSPKLFFPLFWSKF